MTNSVKKDKPPVPKLNLGGVTSSSTLQGKDTKSPPIPEKPVRTKQSQKLPSDVFINPLNVQSKGTPKTTSTPRPKVRTPPISDPKLDKTTSGDRKNPYKRKNPGTPRTPPNIPRLALSKGIPGTPKGVALTGIPEGEEPTSPLSPRAQKFIKAIKRETQKLPQTPRGNTKKEAQEIADSLTGNYSKFQNEVAYLLSPRTDPESQKTGDKTRVIIPSIRLDRVKRNLNEDLSADGTTPPPLVRGPAEPQPLASGRAEQEDRTQPDPVCDAGNIDNDTDSEPEFTEEEKKIILKHWEEYQTLYKKIYTATIATLQYYTALEQDPHKGSDGQYRQEDTSPSKQSQNRVGREKQQAHNKKMIQKRHLMEQKVEKNAQALKKQEEKELLRIKIKKANVARQEKTPPKRPPHGRA